jgi:isocitrate dehydrogenase kinase/phosphatase
MSEEENKPLEFNITDEDAERQNEWAKSAARHMIDEEIEAYKARIAELEEQLKKATKAKKKEDKISSINKAKYDKLVEGATKALAQYESGHKELKYPGFKELKEGLT